MGVTKNETTVSAYATTSREKLTHVQFLTHQNTFMKVVSLMTKAIELNEAGHALYVAHNAYIKYGREASKIESSYIDSSSFYGLAREKMLEAEAILASLPTTFYEQYCGPLISKPHYRCGVQGMLGSHVFKVTYHPSGHVNLTLTTD